MRCEGLKRRLWLSAVSGVGVAVAGFADGVSAQVIRPFLHHTRTFDSLAQADLVALVAAGRQEEAFDEAFEHGDELFETVFNAVDGVGANVGRGQRFTRVPRADLVGPTEWAHHTPSRATGPNAQSCNSCHGVPADDGAGFINSNVHRDPKHLGRLDGMIQRNTPHTFGMAGVQLAAEEMTRELQALLADAESRACGSRFPITVQLRSKGVDFGVITVRRVSVQPCRTDTDFRGLRGIDRDLVVKPFQWKGSVAFVRDFNRGAAHNELGMQAVELVGADVDGDGDSAVNEFSVGDMTALAVYLAAQPRPTTKIELADLGLFTLAPDEREAIVRGRAAFESIGCANCHKPSMSVSNLVYSEPSQLGAYRDKEFPSGARPVDEFVDPGVAVTFDITTDQPDNVLRNDDGSVRFRLGSFRRDDRGRAVVELFGDLKRHNIGQALAESIDEVDTGASTFLTENLWGVGSTSPYLHDGRATTLEEAIRLHGGEAANVRQAFFARPVPEQGDVIKFLNSLVLFKVPEAP